MANLKWAPVAKGTQVSDELQEILEKRLGSAERFSISRDDLDYLAGVRDAAQGPLQREAIELITAIDHYGSIELWLER